MHGLNRPLVRPSPPMAKRQPTFAVQHGVELVDEYAWLRDASWQEVMRDPALLDPKIRAYLEAENDFADAALADTENLQAELFAEMKGRMAENDTSVPSPDGPFEYYTSYVAGGQYVRLCRRPRGGGPEEIMLDGNKEAEGKAYWRIGGAAHSPDHRLLAYTVDDKGSEFYAVRIRDLATGRDLPEVLPDVRGSIVWARDSRTLFYIRLDDHQRALLVQRHRVGTPAAQDVLVYAEPDSGFYITLGETQSGRFIIIGCHAHETSEVLLIDSDQPEGAPRVVTARRRGHEYAVDHQAGRLLILTNSDDAEDFRVCEAPIGTSEVESWREIVPHQPGRLIVDMVAFAGHLVRLERKDGLPRIVVRELASGDEHAIAFDEEAYVLTMSAGYEHDTTRLRFTYESMTTPDQTYDYDMATRTRALRKTREMPSGHNPADYVTRRLLAPAPDGETVPVSVLYKRDTPLDGSAPLLLYGYGAYGVASQTWFTTSWLSLVDRGFVVAIAHVRGGKDKGYRWYTDGKQRRKLNTFTDFIAAGEHLAAQRYTSRGRIVANGGSAGGMLVGAVANMAPELFLGIIADVPFVDVLNTLLDASIPLTPPEWREWGNPIASKEDFDLIRSYSPYDNVGTQAYPHILAYGGLTDPRVTYWEPAKWIARLRAHSTSDSLILLRTNMSAGHAGASGRFEQLKELALDYAFALKIAGK
jgi:oligopeptidase B